MLDSFDATAVRTWCAAGLHALRRHQREIDDLNVYPVPDGDTGTNLVLTFTSAHEALSADDGSPELFSGDGGSPEAVSGGSPEAVSGGGSLEVLSSGSSKVTSGSVLRRMARGALLGARGNSGVIVSQLLKGLADALGDTPVVRGRALAEALRTAAAAAYQAVAEPVEGTVLTVAAAGARGASGAGSDDLATVVRAACRAAADALAHTPEQLPALARAGVVDAGGRGLVVLLDALLETVTGEVAPQQPAPAPRRLSPALTVARETGSEAFGYEVQFLLDAPEGAVTRLKAELSRLGDSLVIVGAGGSDTPTWNVHVHVNDVGAAVEAGVRAGRPHRISVTRFADQVAAEPVLAPDARATVVVAPGAGLAELFVSEGARVVAGTPSTVEILDAVRATGAAFVTVLPNDPNSQAVAASAAAEARSTGIAVRVVPTRSPVQALAALAVRDPGRSFDDDVIAMAEAAGACRYAEVTRASREALTVAGRCQPGDILALVEGEVNLIGTELTGTCRDLLDRLLAGGGELVTLIIGADAPAGLADVLTAHLAAAWPFVEVHSYRGGQPHYPLLVGVE